MVHRGQCHCGAIQLELDSDMPRESITCRICSCRFCQCHAPRYWSHPDAHLAISDPRQKLTRYRFGTSSADFVFCSVCGTFLAALCQIDDGNFAVLNLNCISGMNAAALPSAILSYDAEDLGQRLARRKRNWMPARLNSV